MAKFPGRLFCTEEAEIERHLRGDVHDSDLSHDSDKEDLGGDGSVR